MIVFEGGEGSGKSTLIQMVNENLCSRGYGVLLTREPGGVRIAEDIRSVILDRKNEDMDPKTELLLYCAARVEHLEKKVFPALTI